MKKLVYLLALIGFISCNEAEKANAPESKTSEVKEADCDDKVKDLGKKEPDEVSLLVPTEEGCTLE